MQYAKLCVQNETHIIEVWQLHGGPLYDPSRICPGVVLDTEHYFNLTNVNLYLHPSFDQGVLLGSCLPQFCVY